jgi:hypothetical protein
MSKVSKKAVSSPQRPSQPLARHAVRNVQILRQILGAALTRAVREELTVRNVARMVELPTWEPAEVISWSSAEALAFLEAARPDPLYPAFALLMLDGRRRGEVLDLRWQDVDFQANELRIRQQLQRIQVSCITGPSRPAPVGATCRFSGSPRTRYASAKRSSPPTGPGSATRGQIPAWSSPLARAGQSSRVTSSARSPESAITPVSGRSASMPCGIQLLPCSKALAYQRVTRR